MKDKNQWFPFVSEEINVNDKAIIFCFHHAGGTAATYRPWTVKREEAMIACVELPGKGTRRNERFIFEFSDMLPELAQNIVQFAREKKIILFGHSMGAAMAFYVTDYLYKMFGKKCEKLIVSGRQAPYQENPFEFKTYMGDDALVNELVRYNATPKAVLENQELLDFILPGLRQDYILNETLHYHGEILNVPIAAHAGTGDYEANAEIMGLWSEVTTRPFCLEEFCGSHFFVTDMGEAYKKKVVEEAVKDIREDYE